MRRPDPLTPLKRVVDADPQLSAWNARRVREDALLRAVRRALPRPVAERVHVAEARGATLVLATSAGAIASVVRQKGPDIVAALRRDGWQFDGIALRVQPQSMPVSSDRPVSRQWDGASRRPLAQLEASLAPGPLKAALARFLRNR